MPATKKSPPVPSNEWRKQELHGAAAWIKKTKNGAREYQVTISNQPTSVKGAWLAHWIGQPSSSKDKQDIGQRRFWSLSAAQTAMDAEIQERLRVPKKL